MISIRVWNVESDYATKAVKVIEDELLRSRQLLHIAVRSAGRGALRKCHRKGAHVTDSLRKAIQHYLTQDDYIIFVSNLVNPTSANQCLANHLKSIVEENDFTDKVYFAPDIEDDESLINTEWQNLITHLHAEVENERKQFRKEWNQTITRFHDAFGDTPEGEVVQDFEEALAEVRRERK